MLTCKIVKIQSPAYLCSASACAGKAGSNFNPMCQTIFLSRKGSTVISQCRECKTLNIWQHNLLLSFSPGQFKAFKEFTQLLDTPECTFPFPDGEERLVLRTPHTDISFTFSMDEWEDFQAAMEEAEYMQGVYELLYH
jgi:hypothetical protein